jgi:8-oxo-dGTP pyrophosphatase MutT (NUDIX family)
MPDGQIVEPFYVLEYADWVNVVALTPDGDVVLTRQYRHGVGKTILELPCGRMDDEDGSPLEAMKRELLEETGYGGGEYVKLATLSPNAATHANMSHFFLARGVEKIAEPVLDLTEQIEVVLMPFDEVVALALRGGIGQAVHLATLFLAMEHLKSGR